MLTRDQLIESIVRHIIEIQTASGRSAESINEMTELFGDTNGFDSLNGIEALVLVGVDIDKKLSTELLFPDGDIPVTVGSLANSILKQEEGHYSDT